MENKRKITEPSPEELLLHVTLLSNRAACYLKSPSGVKPIDIKNDTLQVSMNLSVNDCTEALDLLEKMPSTKNVSSLREKILFRRAKARFMICAGTSSNIGGRAIVEEQQLLNEAAKDLLRLLSDNPHNKEAQQLLRVLRTKHAYNKDHDANLSNDSTVGGRLLNDVKRAWEEPPPTSSKSTPLQNTEHYAKNLHEKLARLLAYLSSDDCAGTSDWRDLGRRGGIKLLWKIVMGTTKENPSNSSLDEPNMFQKVPITALHILSCVTSDVSTALQYASNVDLSQQDLTKVIVDASSVKNACPSLAVSGIALFLRLVVAFDDDENFEQERETFKKQNNVDNRAVCQACIAALQCPFSDLPAKAALDLITAWSSPDRDIVAQAIVESYGHCNNNSKIKPKKLTKMEEHKLPPKEFAAYRKKQYEIMQYKARRAKEHSLQLFASKFALNDYQTISGMDALLECAAKSQDVSHVREITVVVGRLFSHIQEGSDHEQKASSKESENNSDHYEQIKRLVGRYLDIKLVDDKNGPVIQEIDEEEASDFGEEKEASEGKSLRTILKMKRGLLVVSLFMANLSEVGVWALGQIWGAEDNDCGRPGLSELTSLIQSEDIRAVRVASELVASCSTSEKGRSLLAPLLQRNGGLLLHTLMESDDADIRSGAASAVAKFGMASTSQEHSISNVDDGELTNMLQLAVDLLSTEGTDDLDQKPAAKSKNDKTTNRDSKVCTTTIERGIEILTFLCSRTIVKEQIANGFRTVDDKQTVVDRLVELASLEDSAEARYAYGIASIFAHICVSVEVLRRQAFEDKDLSMEEYDQLQMLGKTEEEKELLKQKQIENDPEAAVMERIRKLSSHNVPHALVKLLQSGSSGAAVDGQGKSSHSKGSAISKSSDVTQEQLTLAMCRMATEPSVRGIMIQQGCLSACLKLDKDTVSIILSSHLYFPSRHSQIC